jgi:uncharacterized heparinase superfamily protein
VSPAGDRPTLSSVLEAALHGRIGLAERPELLTVWAGAVWAGRELADEWRRWPLHRWLIGRPAAEGLAAAPRDLRPSHAAHGEEVRNGRFVLVGETMEVGVEGDPWDRACPSRRFAVQLHRFAWLPDLLAAGETGSREALRLFLLWRGQFARPVGFAWRSEALERRVFNLACGGRRLTEGASEAETAGFATLLGAQARHLMQLHAGPARAAERLAVAATAGAALSGQAGDQIMETALPRLSRALVAAVLADGGVRTRSPEQAMELLFDLLTLDDGLQQRGREAPVELSRAIDRLTGVVRFFTLGDGGLASFHGGRDGDRARVAAATAHDDDGERRPFGYAPHSGYHRLVGKSLQAMVDAAPPARGGWSLTACAQPAAFELTAGRDRLIVGSGWSLEAADQTLRRSEGGSTATLGEASAGELLKGFPARVLGSRLLDGARRVDARRNESAAGVWLELVHDGWARRFGLLHERRLYLDPALDELRGEERFAQAPGRAAGIVPFAVRFHLHPDVQVSLTLDNHGALLRGPSNRGWRLRSDAGAMTLEPSSYVEGGKPRRGTQIVLRGETAVDTAVRVRWKLSPVESADAGGAASTRKQTTPTADPKS